MTYHLAPSLVQLRAEANTVAPGRSKASDGWIGDTAHGARKSDHNPDYGAGGVVRALDLTNEGLDVDRLIARACADPRTAYVISRGLIYTRDNGFRPVRYAGANPHNQHVHISIRHGAEHAASTASWGLASTAGQGGSAAASAGKPAAPTTPTTSEEDEMNIFRAAGYGIGVLQSQGAWSQLSSEEEKKNLLAAGAREIWVEKKTLDALIKDQRGQYTEVGIR